MRNALLSKRSAIFILLFVCLSVTFALLIFIPRETASADTAEPDYLFKISNGSGGNLYALEYKLPAGGWESGTSASNIQNIIDQIEVLRTGATDPQHCLINFSADGSAGTLDLRNEVVNPGESPVVTLAYGKYYLSGSVTSTQKVIVVGQNAEAVLQNVTIASNSPSDIAIDNFEGGTVVFDKTPVLTGSVFTLLNTIEIAQTFAPESNSKYFLSFNFSVEKDEVIITGGGDYLNHFDTFGQNSTLVAQNGNLVFRDRYRVSFTSDLEIDDDGDNYYVNNENSNVGIYFTDGMPYGEALPEPHLAGFIFLNWMYEYGTDNWIDVDEITTIKTNEEHQLKAKWELEKPLINGSDINKIYDATGSITTTLDHAFTNMQGFSASYQWYKGGEKLDGATNASYAAVNVSDSGDYTLEVNISYNYSSKQTGYTNTFTATQTKEFTVNITKAPLTVTANDKSRHYGAANPHFDFEISGFVTEDDRIKLTLQPEATCSATKTSNAGAYDIILTAGEADNYDFTTLNNGTLTVSKVVLTVTVQNATKIYNDDNPLFSVSYNGFIDGEGEDSLITKPAVSTEATKTANVGSYALTVSGGVSLNYDFKYTNGTLEITKAAQSRPSAKILSAKSGKISVTNVDGAEYSLDGQSWQDGNEFSGLPDGNYKVYIRFKATENFFESEPLTLNVALEADTTLYIILGAAGVVVLALIVFSVIWFGVKKKSFKEIFSAKPSEKVKQKALEKARRQKEQATKNNPDANPFSKYKPNAGENADDGGTSEE